MSQDLKALAAEVRAFKAEADALREARRPWPEQRALYTKAVAAAGACLVALPDGSPKLGVWASYKTELEQFVALNDAEVAEAEQAAEQAAKAEKKAQDLVEAELARVEGVVPEDWMDTLSTDRKGNPTAVPYNATLYLTYHPDLRGKIRWDSFAKCVTVQPGALRDLIEQAEPTLESIVVGVEDWLHAETEGLTFNHSDLKRRIVTVALRNQYSSLKDHLLANDWNGVPLIDRFLIDHCGARTTLADGTDITEHLLRISRRFFISLAARGLEPGCQVDTVLVLEGDQGLRKTSVFRILGGPFACETELAIGGDKDSKQLASTRWIIELAELDSIRNRSHTTVNAFITQRVDYYRPPYSAQHEAFLRICVLVGTTNKEEWIEDSTGDRRFWPVFVTKIDLAKIKADRDQLIAEAVHAFRAGGIDKCSTCAAGHRAGGEDRCREHRWWLDPAEQKVANRVTAQRATEVAYTERIKEWWGNLGKTALTARSVDPDSLAFADVADALKLAPDKWEREKVAIGKALKQIGFIRYQKSTGERRYKPDAALRAWREARGQVGTNDPEKQNP